MAPEFKGKAFGIQTSQRPISYETFLELKSKGLLPKMTGFMNSRNPRGRKELSRYIAQAHLNIADLVAQMELGQTPVGLKLLVDLLPLMVKLEQVTVFFSGDLPPFVELDELLQFNERMAAEIEKMAGGREQKKPL